MSIRKGSQHVLAGPASGPVVRTPELRRNRVYLKALRHAEMAAWEETLPVPRTVPKVEPKAPRLPSPAREVGEARLYVLLFVLAVLTMGYQLHTLLQSAHGWHDFVQFVQQFLT